VREHFDKWLAAMNLLFHTKNVGEKRMVRWSFVPNGVHHVVLRTYHTEPWRIEDEILYRGPDFDKALECFSCAT